MTEVYIDDADASVAYSGSWQLSTDDLRSRDHTIHFTDAVNSKATLTFTGISAMVYGIVRSSETPQSSYSIDGGDPTVFRGTPQVLSQYGVLFYTSPSLRNGQHTLVITNLNGTNTLFIDYFIIVTTGNASTPGSAVTSSTFIPTSTRTLISSSTSSLRSGTTQSSSSSSTVPIPFVSSAPSSVISPATNTPAMSATTSNQSHLKAAIIGCVVALVIIAIFSVVCLWLRRRRKKEKPKSWIFSSSTDSPAVLVAPTLPGHSLATDSSAALVAPNLPPQPEDTPQVTQQLSNYPMSEPPPYEAMDLANSTNARVGAAQHLGSGVDLKRSG